LTKKWKIRTGGGVYDYGNPRAWGITHFGNSEGRGELKYGSRPWYGMDIFWNCPMEIVVGIFPRSQQYIFFGKTTLYIGIK